MRNDRATVLENLRRRAAVFPDGAPQARNEGERRGQGAGVFPSGFFRMPRAGI